MDYIVLIFGECIKYQLWDRVYLQSSISVQTNRKTDFHKEYTRQRWCLGPWIRFQPSGLVVWVGSSFGFYAYLGKYLLRVNFIIVISQVTSGQNRVWNNCKPFAELYLTKEMNYGLSLYLGIVRQIIINELKLVSKYLTHQPLPTVRVGITVQFHLKHDMLKEDSYEAVPSKQTS